MVNTNLKEKNSLPLKHEFVPPIDYKANRSSPVKWILSHVFHYKRFLIPTLIFVLLSSAFQSLVPVYIGDLITYYQSHNNTLPDTVLNQFVLLILVVGLASAFTTLGGRWSNEVISQKMEISARDELYSNLIGKSLTFHDNQTIGDLMSRAAADVRQLNFMVSPGFTLVFSAIVGILIPLFFISQINIQLIFVPGLFLIFFIIFLNLYNKKYAPVAYGQRVIAGTLTSRLNEVITGIFVMRAMSQEEKERSIFNKNSEDYRQNSIQQGKVIARYYPMLFFGLAMVFSLLHGILLLNSNTISLGDLIAFIGLVQLLRFPTTSNIFAFTNLTMGVQSAKRILQILNWESDIDLNSSGYAQEIKGNIKFENVTFGYSPTKPVLKNVTFFVEPGQTIALVGMTGSGKTTITKLLTRLYEPQEGFIQVDGVDLRDWSINSLRSQTALVEQDVFLLSKSIKENISFGMNVPMERIIEAAQKAQAHNFIMEFPDNYETVIGERGFTLSGGQRQRIAIARAILRNPRILILDDASSAIDSRTEDEIQQAIKTVLKDRVSFLITHRLAQIRRADKIILIDKGKISAMGTHLDLLRESSIYKSIFSSFDEYDKFYGNIEVTSGGMN